MRGQLGLNILGEVVDAPALCTSLKGVPICQIVAESLHLNALSSTILFAMAASQDFRAFALLNSLGAVFLAHVTAHGSCSATIDEFSGPHLWGRRFGPAPTTTTPPSPDRFVGMALGNEGCLAGRTARSVSGSRNPRPQPSLSRDLARRSENLPAARKEKAGISV
jgi:hypothetical protein